MKKSEESLRKSYARMELLGVKPKELPKGKRGILDLEQKVLTDIGEGSRKCERYSEMEKERMMECHELFGEEHISLGLPPSTRKIWIDDAIARCFGRPIGEMWFHFVQSSKACPRCVAGNCQYGNGPHIWLNQFKVDYHELLLSQKRTTAECVKKLGYKDKKSYARFIWKNKLEKPHDWCVERKCKRRPARPTGKKVTYRMVYNAIKIVDEKCDAILRVEKKLDLVLEAFAQLSAVQARVVEHAKQSNLDGIFKLAHG